VLGILAQIGGLTKWRTQINGQPFSSSIFAQDTFSSFFKLAICSKIVNCDHMLRPERTEDYKTEDYSNKKQRIAKQRITKLVRVLINVAVWFR
jgi:hypothetical protein